VSNWEIRLLVDGKEVPLDEIELIEDYKRRETTIVASTVKGEINLSLKKAKDLAREVDYFLNNLLEI